MAGTEAQQEHMQGCFACAYLAQPQSLPGIFLIFGISKKIQAACCISTKQLLANKKKLWVGCFVVVFLFFNVCE